MRLTMKKATGPARHFALLPLAGAAPIAAGHLRPRFLYKEDMELCLRLEAAKSEILLCCRHSSPCLLFVLAECALAFWGDL